MYVQQKTSDHGNVYSNLKLTSSDFRNDTQVKNINMLNFFIGKQISGTVKFLRFYVFLDFLKKKLDKNFS